MHNLMRMGVLLVVIVVVGLFTYMAWDQIAFSMGWPRPTPGAGIGGVFLGLLVNVLWHNQFMIGGMNANPADAGGQEVS